MKRDVINGYEYLIFEEAEISEAEVAQAQGLRVLIATTCHECRGYIEATLEQFRRRARDPIAHTQSYHTSIWR